MAGSGEGPSPLVVSAILDLLPHCCANLPLSSPNFGFKSPRGSVLPCRVVRWRRLGEAVAGQGDALRAALSGEDTGANAGLLLLLRAVDRFHAAHGRFPGTYDGCKAHSK